MKDRERQKTCKALEDLVRVEYQAIAAYEQALGEDPEAKLRRKYNRFLRDHERQARDLNSRLVELGGEPVEPGASSGSLAAGLWGRITGMVGDKASLNGMYTGAKDGINRYLKVLDDIADAKALGLIRRNLESKQAEIEWLDEQMAHGETPAVKASTEAREQKVEAALESQEKKVSKGGIFGLPIWLLLTGAVAAVFFFLRRKSEPDFEDEAFQYDAGEFTADASAPGVDISGNEGDRQLHTPTI